MDEIELGAGGTRATIVPERGGMATAWSIDGNGAPVFYLDRATLDDRTKNVRGGAPVLYPTPGKLAGDAWRRDGRSGALPQHGFARNAAWEVTTRAGDALTVRLDREGNDAWPWASSVELAYRVTERSLAIDARIENRADTAMPFGFGFHPYFTLTDPASFAFDTGATRAFDNVTKREIAYAGVTLGDAEVDLHLLDHGASTFDFTVDGRRITIAGGPEYTHWVLWRPPGKPFVCVEPWTCPGDAMNTGTKLLALAPGETRTLSLALTARPAAAG